jgi:hypothetical protein
MARGWGWGSSIPIPSFKIFIFQVKKASKIYKLICDLVEGDAESDIVDSGKNKSNIAG